MDSDDYQKPNQADNELLKQEIHKRKEAELASHENFEKYWGLFTGVRDAILIADTERNIIDCNPAFIEIFGYTLEEIKGKKTLYLYENEQQFKELGQALKQHFGQAGFIKTVNYRRKNKEIFPGETGVYYLKDLNGNVTGFIGLIRDISKRQKIEQEKEQLILSLQHALKEVKTLSGLLPICSACKKVRDDKGYWKQIETYLHEHSEADFTHGICPECMVQLYGHLDEEE